MGSPVLTEQQRGLAAVDGRTFPLESAEIRGRAAGGLAETVLVQRFSNPYAEPLEVLYTMPLPADGAVVGYTMQLGDRRIVGEIETLEAAQESYRKALMEGRTAGLLEQRRADTFVQKLGNLPPGAEVEVELRSCTCWRSTRRRGTGLRSGSTASRPLSACDTRALPAGCRMPRTSTRPARTRQEPRCG